MLIGMISFNLESQIFGCRSAMHIVSKSLHATSMATMLALTLALSLVQILTRGNLLPVVKAEILHQSCPFSEPATNGTHEVFRGQDVIWQIPPSPRATLFLAHGGYKDPFLYFDPGPGCPQCYGLPETRMAVLDALQEGYAVLTLKSVGSCWEFWPLDAAPDKDLGIVIDLVHEWTRRHSLAHLPVLGWGQSVGGIFLSSLALLLPLQSLVLMCSDGEAKSLAMANPDEYPPTFFAYMNNTDYNTMVTTVHDVKVSESILAERGVPVFEKLVPPVPLSATIFAERVPCISFDVSERIHEAFKRDGSWLDENDYLVKDPVENDWRSVLLEGNALAFCEEAGDMCLAEHVEEVLKVAQGIHAFTRDANAEIFAWLNAASSSSIASA